MRPQCPGVRFDDVSETESCECLQKHTCLASSSGDPICKHRVASYLAVGLLDPSPLAPALAARDYRSGQDWESCSP